MKKESRSQAAKAARTTVVNLRHLTRVEAEDLGVVYVGRKCRRWQASRWGNPHWIGRDGTREECIEKYAQGLLADRLKVVRVRTELAGKVLACWCHPEPCHAHVLAAVADGSISTWADVERLMEDRAAGEDLPAAVVLAELSA